MSNLFFSFDPMVVITVRTTVLRSGLALLSEPLGINIIMDLARDLLTNPTVTRVATRGVQTVVSSSSDLLTNPRVTRVVTRTAQTAVNSSSNLSTGSGFLDVYLAPTIDAKTITIPNIYIEERNTYNLRRDCWPSHGWWHNSFNNSYRLCGKHGRCNVECIFRRHPQPSYYQCRRCYPSICTYLHDDCITCFHAINYEGRLVFRILKTPLSNT